VRAACRRALEVRAPGLGDNAGGALGYAFHRFTGGIQPQDRGGATFFGAPNLACSPGAPHPQLGSRRNRSRGSLFDQVEHPNRCLAGPSSGDPCQGGVHVPDWCITIVDCKRGAICCTGANKGLPPGLVRQAFAGSAGSALEDAGNNKVGSGACGPRLIAAGHILRAAASLIVGCIRGFGICVKD